MQLNISIKNFKSIQSADLKLNTGLNILIGPNGSGKTCILSSLKFIRDLFEAGVATSIARAGGRRAYSRGKRQIQFSILHDYGDRIVNRRKQSCSLSWKVIISQQGPDMIACIVYEEIEIFAGKKNSKLTLFKLSVDRRKSKKRMNLRIGKSNQIGRDLFEAWLYQFPGRSKTKIIEELRNSFSSIRKNLKENFDIPILQSLSSMDNSIDTLISHFYLINEYNIIPDIARKSTDQLPIAQMGPDGSAVGEVIHALENENFQKILDSRNIYDYNRQINTSVLGKDIWRFN